MFTGIVQATATVSKIIDHSDRRDFVLLFPEHLTIDLTLGASVAVEGACLTITSISHHYVSFTLIKETLDKTTLGQLIVGDKVNIERAAKWGDEIGGHLVSGHIHDRAKIITIEASENNYILSLRPPAKWLKYIFPKGYIALAGVSLTVVNVNHQENYFTVHLIPETRNRTTLEHYPLKAEINFEIETSTQIIVDTVNAYLEEKKPI